MRGYFKKLIEGSKNLILIAVASSLLASAAGFLWGLIKTLVIIFSFVTSYGRDSLDMIALIELMDIFLIATVLFIFAMGMYELFIESMRLSDKPINFSTSELKSENIFGKT